MIKLKHLIYENTQGEYYIRFGDIPKGGKSFDRISQTHEGGVSVYPAEWDSTINRWRIQDEILNNSGMYGLQDLVSAIHDGELRVVYLLQGTKIDHYLGNDGEPLLDAASIKIIKKLKPEEFYSDIIGTDWHEPMEPYDPAEHKLFSRTDDFDYDKAIKVMADMGPAMVDKFNSLLKGAKAGNEEDIDTLKLVLHQKQIDQILANL